MITPSPLLFEITTPLGFSVRTIADYWQRLVGKHPDDGIKEGEPVWPK